MKYKKQPSHVSLLAACLCLALAGCSAGSTTAESASSAVEQPAATSTEAPTATPGPVPPTFTHIDVDAPNNCSVNGYMESPYYEINKERLASKDLQVLTDDSGNPCTTYSGHTIYTYTAGTGVGEIPADADSSYAGYQQKCIISGTEVFDLDNDTEAIDYPNDTTQLRKEGTCERIYVYNTEDMYNQAVELRTEGQEILAGTRNGPARCVVLNGSVVPGAEYVVDDDGTIEVSLFKLAINYSKKALINEGYGILRVPGTYQLTESFPSAKTTQDQYSTYTLNNTINAGAGTYTYVGTNTPPDIWQVDFPLPADTTFTMPVEEISRILGWDFYISNDDGGILKVVTDELDDTNPDNFVVYDESTTSNESQVIYQEETVTEIDLP